MKQVEFAINKIQCKREILIAVTLMPIYPYSILWWALQFSFLILFLFIGLGVGLSMYSRSAYLNLHYNEKENIQD